MITRCKLISQSISLLAFSITFIAVFISLDGPIVFGLLIYTEQFVSIVLGAGISICFLCYRINREYLSNYISWYDIILAILGLFTGIHLAIRYPILSTDFYSHPKETFIIGAILIPLLFESLRRCFGWSLTVVISIFFIYSLSADLVPGTLQGMSSSLPEILSFLAIDSTAILGTPLVIVVTVVILFMFFGNILMISGGSKWFTDLSIAALGNTRGGSAKISVVASALFGSVSGSAVANVASTGVITIPLMKQSGFSARSAAAFEAIASTGGQILPPVMGAAAFLIAEFLQVSYREVILSATVPAILFFLAVLIQADLEAAKFSIPPVKKELIKPVKTILKSGWFFPIPFVILIMLLFVLNMSPAKAAIYSIISLLFLTKLFSHHRNNISIISIWNAIQETGKSSVGIIIIGASAGIIIGIFEHTGLSFGLTYLLVQFGQGSLFLLLILTGIICIVLGMGMPTTGIYLLVATLAAPPLIELGVEPMAAHLFILYYGLLSMISPPVAVAAFTAASLANSGPMETAITSVRIGWPAFIFPFLFVYSPSLLLEGDVYHIILAIITAFCGVWLISITSVGYFRRKLNMIERCIIGMSGLLLITPGDIFDGAIWINITGIIFILTFYAKNAISNNFNN